LRRFILKFFGYWRPEDEKKWRLENLSASEWYATATREEIDESLAHLLEDEMTDAEYFKIYGGDEEAIKAAKASWLRAGQEVVASTKKMINEIRW
jgi:hypothetical protein